MHLTPIQQNAVNLRYKMLLSAMTGQRKDFTAAKKEYAKFAVENFEEVKGTPFKKFSVPLFSAVGLKMAFVVLIDKLRRLTPEEKQLKKLGQKEAIKRKLDQII